MNATGVLENWINDFMYMRQTMDWGVLNYTFHPFVIGRGHRMMVLEKLMRTLAEHGAEFCTMEEAAARFDRKFPFQS
jgi:peptidoglycan/xylan/chitin deacetylase (PgdA/CDA1 family)